MVMWTVPTIESAGQLVDLELGLGAARRRRARVDDDAGGQVGGDVAWVLGGGEFSVLPSRGLVLNWAAIRIW